MEGGRKLRSQATSKNVSEMQQNPEMTESEHERSNDEEETMQAEANTDQNVLLQALNASHRVKRL